MLKPFFKNFLSGLYDLIYPPHCLVCKKHLRNTSAKKCLCGLCLGLIRPNRPPFCQKCSRFLEKNPQDDLCPECLKNHYYFDRAWAVTLYEDVMKKLIHLFKYGHKIYLKETFHQLITSFLFTYHLDMERFDLLVPVPLHCARLRERGYNQSELLTEGLSKQFQIKQSLGNLIRTHPTRNQALLPKKERWTNIQGAFTIKDPTEFGEKSVLIVDDLLTTGATVSEVARLLKKAKAVRVEVLTLSIAI